MAYRNGENKSIADIYPEILQTQILTRLDGPALASAACASPLFHQLSATDKVWSDLCNSTWPSTAHPLIHRSVSAFPGGHRAFFSDSFPVLRPGRRRYRRRRNTTPSSELISAVDIKYKDNLLFSAVEVTDAGAAGEFFDSDFRVGVLDPKEAIILPGKFNREDDAYLTDLKENMTLSWIMIDPTAKRAANVSSSRPVSARPHWVNGDIEVKYATVMPGGDGGALVELRIAAMLEWKGAELQLRGVNLQVLDTDDKCLNGKESLVILAEALGIGKRMKGKKGDEKERYTKFVEMKRKRIEGNQWLILNPGVVFTTFFILFFLLAVFYMLRLFSSI